MFVAAIGVKGLALVVRRLQEFVVDGLRRNEHQGYIEGAFIGHDIFLGDGVGMAFHRGGESAARFVALGADPAIGVQRKFRVNGHYFFVAELDHGVRCFSTGKAMLHLVLRARKGIFEQALEGHFAEGAARLSAAQNTFERLRGLGHLSPGLLDFAKLQLDLADLIAGVLELAGHFGLRVGSHLAGNLGGVPDGVLQGGGDTIEALRDTLGDRFQLSSARGLRRCDRLQVAAQFVHLGFDGAALLAVLQALQSQPDHQDGHKNNAANQECVHSLSDTNTGNGLLTLRRIGEGANRTSDTGKK